MRIVLMICCILMLALPAKALEIAGVTIPKPSPATTARPWC